MSLKEELDHLFNPKSIAVIGASNKFGSWGFGVLSRLLTSNNDRDIYAVNINESEVQGLKAYNSVVEVPGAVDFAVIVVPNNDIPQVMRDCVSMGVKSAAVISSGLAEWGPEGAKIQQEMVEIARKGGIRFVGPNCMGHFNTHSSLYTVSFLPPLGKGNVALISQTGNGSLSMLNYGMKMGLGFSKYVSSGNEADLKFVDYMEYLADDEETKIILGYIEGIREGRRFFESASEITKKKPVVIMKTGRTDAGARGVYSHSAALAGSDIVTDTAFRQSGIIRVNEMSELGDVAMSLLGQPLPRGRKVGVLAMAGGLAVMAADAVMGQGLEMPQFSETTMNRLNSILSRRWSHCNPIDPGGEFSTFYCIEPMLEDENIDAILAVGGFGAIAGIANWVGIPPTGDYDIEELNRFAEDAEIKNLKKTIELMRKYKKPVLFAAMVVGAEEKGESYKKLTENHLRPYPTIEKAACALRHLVEYSEYLGFARRS